MLGAYLFAVATNQPICRKYLPEWKVVSIVRVMEPHTPDNARILLDYANTTTRHAAGVSLAWLCYIALCAGGAIAAIGLAYANVTDSTPAPAWIAGGLWVGIGVAFTAGATALSPPTRRGFNTRWTVMIGVWVVLWVVVSFLNSSFTLGHGIALAAGFMAVAVLGPIWDIVAVNKK